MRKLATAYTLSVSHSLDSSPIGRAKGGCAAGFARLALCAGRARPPNLVHHPPNYRPLSRYVGTFNAAYPGWGFFPGIFCTSIRFFPTSWVTALPWFT